MTGSRGLPGRLDRRHLTCIIALADFGSFRAAADQLFITPSAVAATIRQTEHVVGFSLVERHHGAVQLNPAGWDVAGRARHALAALDDVAGESEGPGRRGVLRIMATPTTAEQTAPHLAAMVHRLHPDLFIQVTSSSRAIVSDVASAVLDRAAHVGIAQRPARPVNGLEVVSLEEWTVHFVFPAGAVPRGGRVSVDEMVKHGLVAVPHFESSDVYRALVRTSQAIDGAIRVRSAFREQFADLALEGVAGFLCHHPQLPTIHALGLRSAAIEADATRAIVAFARRDHGSPAVAEFLAACRKYRRARARQPV